MSDIHRARGAFTQIPISCSSQSPSRATRHYRIDSDQDGNAVSRSAISLNVHERAKSRWESTRQRVVNAVASCINHASALAPELLSIGVEVADSGVVPGLSGVARSLWKLWRAIEQVWVNKDNALCLIRRCVDILDCIKAEINRNGATVPTALAVPILRLEDTLGIIHRCMRKHIRRALVLQYLKKNSISEDISYCGSLLDDALTLINFGLGLNVQQTLIEIVIHRGSVIQSREATNHA